MERSSVSRRTVIRGLALAALSTVIGGGLVACQQAPPPSQSAATPPPAPSPQVVEKVVTQVVEKPVAVTVTPQARKGKLTATWGGWTPTPNMVKGPDNPSPHNKINSVLASYQQANPGVSVESITVPKSMNGRQWIVAQQSAGTIPNIVSASFWSIKQDIGKNWWVNLDAFLQQPNPYVKAGDPGSAHWLDQFFPVPTSEALIDGSWYNLVFGLETTFFYYNKDMFDQAGLQVPTTYAEFVNVCKTFTSKGIQFPYGGEYIAPPDTLRWYRVQLGDMIMARDVTAKVNPGQGVTTNEQVACALKNHLFSPQMPQYREWLQLFKNLVPFMGPGWDVPDPNWPLGSLTLFLQKKIPIMENETNIFKQLQTDPSVGFKWGTFFAPTLTKETTQFVSDPPAQPWPIGGPVGDDFAIATTASKSGVLDVCVDLMRWISTPENIGAIQGEIGAQLPNVKGVQVDEFLQEPMKAVSTSIGEQHMFTYEDDKMDDEASTAIMQAWLAYCLDKLSIDDAIKQIDAANQQFVTRYSKQVNLTC